MPTPVEVVPPAPAEVVPPKVEATPPAPPVEVKTEAAPKVEAKTETPPAPVTPPAPAPQAEGWEKKRIAELTAKLAAERAKNAAPPAPVALEGDTPEAVNARVEARAKQLADERVALEAWNSRCNDAAAQGRLAHPDFDSRLGEVKSAIDGSDPQEVNGYNNVLAAALETGKASEVLYDLAADPGKFRELMKLPPMKLAVEVATRASKLGALPEPSALPKPITPLGSRGEHYEGIKPDDAKQGMKLPKAEWFKQREAQARERGIQ
jgi:hypothetical protein